MVKGAATLGSKKLIPDKREAHSSDPAAMRECVVKGSSVPTGAVRLALRIWVGNATAVTLASCYHSLTLFFLRQGTLLCRIAVPSVAPGLSSRLGDVKEEPGQSCLRICSCQYLRQ